MNDLVLVDKNKWELLKEQSVAIVRSGLGPKGVTPEQATIIALKGYEMNLGPMRSLEGIFVINGRTTMAAALMMSLIRERCPSARVHVKTSTDKGCEIVASRENQEPETFSFNEADAKRANLLSKGPWQQFPQDMYWARAVSRMGRRMFSDILQGATYTPEELGAEVDGTGLPGQPFSGSQGVDTDRAKDLNARMESIKDVTPEEPEPAKEEKKVTRKAQAPKVEKKADPVPEEPKPAPAPEPVSAPAPAAPPKLAAVPTPAPLRAVDERDSEPEEAPASEIDEDYSKTVIRAGIHTGKTFGELGQKKIFEMYTKLMKLVSQKKADEIQPATIDFITHAELYLHDYNPGLEG